MSDTSPETGHSDQRFVSYAQHREDVVLWRALAGVTPGRYVDVGAAHPVVDSVTAALYERGWRGVNIEPAPEHVVALTEARPDDIVVPCGIGSESGTLSLHVVPGTGLSTFDSRLAELAADRSDTHELSVAVRRLDDVLDEHLAPGDEIHVLKVDVEGFEAAVLSSIDLGRWRPWVVVVEATEPNSSVPTHEQWEHLLDAAGYRCCLFDGLNRFYVHPDHADLAPTLSYPAGPLDDFVDAHTVNQDRTIDVLRAEVERRETQLLAGAEERGRLTYAHEEVVRAHSVLIEDQQRWRSEYQAKAADLAAARQDLANLQALHNRLMSSVSWRVTAPLRAVRSRVGSASESERGTTSESADGTRSRRLSGDAPDRLESAFCQRLAAAAGALVGEDASARPVPVGEIGEAIAAFVDALAVTDASPSAVAWLALVVVHGTYPDELAVRGESRVLGRLTAEDYGARLLDRFRGLQDDGQGSLDELIIVDDRPIVDITHTVQHDLQTGIQRVVREACSRWITNKRVAPVWWDPALPGLRRLPADHVDRFVHWPERLKASVSGEPVIYSLADGDSGVVVPWGVPALLPELAAEIDRTEGYRALAFSGVSTGLSLIGYDIIPITAAETVTEAMSHRFSLYLAMVKRSQRVAAISEAAAGDFRAFNAALASQGLTGPDVAAHLLPPSPAPVGPDSIAAVRRKFGVGDTPFVLIVGSHEPRKNHLVVLDAAERLWSEGHEFVTVFIGGSGWRSEPFNEEVDRLRALGRPVRVHRGASEEELWAAYAAASFSVFPSLVEGYGLPIVESIASGTPVITTNYGSMAEVAAGGGAVLIDPDDAVALAAEMRSLLDDDAALEQLRAEAAARSFPSWDDYAESVWDFLVGQP